MKEWLRRSLFPKGDLHGPRDHRCDTSVLEMETDNLKDWHPDGVADKYETSWSLLVCPVCGRVRVQCFSADLLLSWEERPEMRGMFGPFGPDDVRL